MVYCWTLGYYYTQIHPCMARSCYCYCVHHRRRSPAPERSKDTGTVPRMCRHIHTPNTTLGNLHQEGTLTRGWHASKAVLRLWPAAECSKSVNSRELRASDLDAYYSLHPWTTHTRVRRCPMQRPQSSTHGYTAFAHQIPFSRDHRMRVHRSLPSTGSKQSKLHHIHPFERSKRHVAIVQYTLLHSNECKEHVVGSHKMAQFLVENTEHTLLPLRTRDARERGKLVRRSFRPGSGQLS